MCQPHLDKVPSVARASAGLVLESDSGHAGLLCFGVVAASLALASVLLKQLILLLLLVV